MNISAVRVLSPDGMVFIDGAVISDSLGEVEMTLSRMQLERYADVLIWGLTTARRKAFRPYDNVLIRYDGEALPLLEVLYRKLLQRKWNVILRAMPAPIMERDFIFMTDNRQRQIIPPGEKELYEALHGNIYLHAPSSLTHLKNADTRRINEMLITRKKLRTVLDSREEAGIFGWTLCTYPTEALAAQAGLSLDEYARQIVRACFLNEKDPVKKWGDVYVQATEIKKWINSLPIKNLHVENSSMNLRIRLGEKRRFIGISGHNIPSFEIFTSPDWRETEGTYYADQPSYRNGNYVEGVRFEFRRGRVTSLSARKGEAFIKKILDMDTGARQIGEFSLTDRRFSRINRFMADTLFDENYGGKYGNCHLALGSSYTDTFKGNLKSLTPELKKKLGYNDSALHWDLVNTENKTVTAELKNGRKMVIYTDGEFRC